MNQDNIDIQEVLQEKEQKKKAIYNGKITCYNAPD